MYFKAGLTALVLTSLLFSGCSQHARLENHPMHPTGLKIKDGIKVVYQIKTDETKDGIGSGLYYVRKLVNAYERLGVLQQDR